MSNMSRLKHLLTMTLAGSGLLLLSATANAQYHSEYHFPDRYLVQGDRDARIQSHDRIFDRLQADLDRANDRARPFSGDQSRVARAEQNVTETRNTLATGTYDGREFDRTIASVQRVIDVNPLSEETRALLSHDVHQLRDLQFRLQG